jgi:hypothetical protein
MAGGNAAVALTGDDRVIPRPSRLGGEVALLAWALTSSDPISRVAKPFLRPLLDLLRCVRHTCLAVGDLSSYSSTEAVIW